MMTVNFELYGVEWIAIGSFDAGSPGGREEPPEPACFEISEIFVEEGGKTFNAEWVFMSTLVDAICKAADEAAEKHYNEDRNELHYEPEYE